MVSIKWVRWKTLSGGFMILDGNVPPDSAYFDNCNAQAHDWVAQIATSGDVQEQKKKKGFNGNIHDPRFFAWVNNFYCLLNSLA